jgi:hypothetical protein
LKGLTVVTTVHAEPAHIVSRLADLGLEEEPLRIAVSRGQLAVSNCTRNHPRWFPPLAGCAETVRGLRDYLATLQWENCDNNNYARSLDPSGQLAIAVATGNEGTGLVDSSPATSSSKGRSTVEAILINQFQLDMFEELKVQAIDAASQQAIQDDKRVMWILLMYRAKDETRAELSLPVAIGADMRVNNWRERIILRPIPRDPEGIPVTQPQLPDLDVRVARRA